ncbi:hypothetical protein [uncultured Marinobacter sp.]|uniref:hypothetical protein n=1 Tax=uncultured Marinobacter sp. TaxID=187379 RepID=UPI002618065B|nr:hypothetical protein [uncultured Marinobacter sp.]
MLFEDSAAIIGLLVAMTGIFRADHACMYWMDGAASLIMGLILGGTAIWLAYPQVKRVFVEAESLKVHAATHQRD